MNDDFLRDLQLSKAMFNKTKPLLLNLCAQIPGMFSNKDLSITCMEDQDNELKKHLDCDCGIDYHIVEKQTGKTLELAWRAESCALSLYPRDGVYNAFSIRMERDKPNSAERCEYKKRNDAIQQDLAYPKYQAQVIFDPYDNNAILSLALAKMSDIYEAHNKYGLWRLCNPFNKNRPVTFHDVSWKLMKDYGYTIYEWYRDNDCKPTTYLDTKRNEYYFVKDKQEAV